MLLIACPHCGPRPSSEFVFGGEVRRRPPVDGVAPSDWRTYLYERDNRADEVDEEWFHGLGCRRFLVIRRHRTTNRIAWVRDRARA